MRCRGLHSLANPAYLSPFPFSALPSVAPYCIPGGVRVVSAEQVVKFSTFYETAAVSKCFVIRAAVFSACRLELLLVRPTFGCEFVGLADSSGIKDAFPST
jgi:hypothetical protein